MRELPPCPRFDGRHLDEHLLRTRFRYFLEVLWHTTGKFDVAPLGEVDLDGADWIDAGPGYRAVLAFRGMGKTDMYTCAYAAYRHFRQPDTCIGVFSKAYEFACAMVGQVRQWYEDVWFLRHLAPEKGQKDRDNEFVVGDLSLGKNRSLIAVGIDGMITGKRAHLVIGDDIETPENTKTVEAREILKKKVAEFRRIASFGDQNQRDKSDLSHGQGEVVGIGTPHHEESIWDYMAENAGYSRRDYPMMLPPRSGDFAREKIGFLAPIIRRMTEDYEAEHGPIADESVVIPTVPERFGRESVVSRMADGPWSFMMQEMMIAKGGVGFRPLRLSDLIVPDFDFSDRNVPIWIKWGVSTSDGSTARGDIETVGLGGGHMHRQIAHAPRDEFAELTDVRMRIDPSGAGSDETAWAIGGTMAGYVWVMEVGGVGGTYPNEIKDRSHGNDGAGDQTIALLASRARHFGVRRIVIEDVDGSGLYAAALQRACDRLRVTPGDPKHPQFRRDGWSCAVEAERVDRSAAKPRRIVTALQSVMTQHKLVVAVACLKPTPSLPRHYELQYQISAILPGVKDGGIKHDDRVEVLAMLVKDFKDAVSADEDRLLERVREDRELMDEEAWNRMMGIDDGGEPESIVGRV